MKKLVTLLAVLLILFVSCNDDDQIVREQFTLKGIIENSTNVQETNALEYDFLMARWGEEYVFSERLVNFCSGYDEDKTWVNVFTYDKVLFIMIDTVIYKTKVDVNRGSGICWDLALDDKK